MPIQMEQMDFSGFAQHARQQGVTLIELVVTVVVVGILAAIAVPSFTDFFKKQRVVGASSELSSLMSYARAQSLKRDEAMTITVKDPVSGQWCFGLVVSTAPCDCDAGSNSCLVDGVLRTSNFEAFPDVSISISPAATSVTMQYDPVRGTVSTVPDIEFQTNSDFSLEVQSTKLGRASLCVPTGSTIGGYEPCS